MTPRPRVAAMRAVDARGAAALVAAAGGGVAIVAGGTSLLAPVPSESDQAGFALVGGGLLLLLLAATLLAPASKAARWALALAWGAWLGGWAGVLVPAYKDTLGSDLAARGARGLAGDVVLHLLMWPAEVALGLVLGFADATTPRWIVLGWAVGLALGGLVAQRLSAGTRS